MPVSDICDMVLSRRLIQELMVASPLILLLGLAVGSRTRVEAVDIAGYGPEAQDQIFAFREPVRKAEMAADEPDRIKRAESVRAVAREWLDLSAAGVIRPLPSANAFDSMREGVKGQITHAVEGLCSQLLNSARESIKSQRLRPAMEDLMLGLEVAQILKGSDLFSVAFFSVRQRHMLYELAGIASELPPDLRGHAIDRLKRIKLSDGFVELLAARAQRQRTRALPRSHAANQSIEDTSPVVHAGEMDGRPANTTAMARRFSRIVLAQRGSMLPNVVSEYRFAWASEQQTAALIQSVIQSMVSEAAE